MPKITEMWAWVAVEQEPDDEGIIGGMHPVFGAMPLIGADKARVESFREMAEAAARQTGMRVRLVRFHARQDMETIGTRVH